MMPELKYRKLPVEVEAFKLGEAWPDWWADAVSANKVKTYNQDERWRGGPDYALIQTLEGEMRAEKGDWIIQGVKGEIYPCKPDIFALTYEPATCPDGGDSLREALPLLREWILAIEGLPLSKVDQPKQVRRLYELADKISAALAAKDARNNGGETS